MRIALVALAFILPAAITGCQKSYTYEVYFVVRDAITGKVIENVEISRPLPTHDFPVRTNSKGEANSQFTVSDGSFAVGTGEYNASFRIKIKFSKRGYRDETVDVTPKREPESTPVRVRVYIYMRPTQ